MTLLLRLLALTLPDAVKSRMLAQLAAATADAFQRPSPDLRGLPFAERLRRYALFTRDEAELSLRSGDADAVRARLHENARRLGTQLRRSLRIRDIDQALAAGQALYRVIGIDLQPGARGQVTVGSCYFADFYSGPVCRLISALDEGLFDGLSGGGRFEFSERMTEGCEVCRARLQLEGAAR